MLNPHRTNPTAWRPEDGHLLQKLRTHAGLDELVFARQNTLSLAQLRELESGIGHHFYNDPIKRNAGVKLLKKLGYEFPEPPPPPPQADPLPVTSTVTTVPAPEALTVTVGDADLDRPAPARGWMLHPAVWLSGLLTTGVLAFAVLQAQGPWSAEPSPAPALQSGPLQPSWPSTASAPSITEAPTATGGTAEEAPQTERALSDPAPAPAAQDLAPSRIALAACDDAHRHHSAYHTPSHPIKPGNYVYIEARSDSQLCVLDSQNKLSVLSLKAGMSHTVNGMAPFLMHASDWQGLQVFFQGRPVHIEHGRNAHLVLQSLPL